MTKASIRGLTINKPPTSENHYPDAIIRILNIPFVVIEAKHPAKDIEQAIKEGVLYASQLNSLWEHGFNPVHFVIAINGNKVSVCKSNSQSPKWELDFEEISLATKKFETFIEELNRSSLHRIAESYVSKSQSPNIFCPLKRFGEAGRVSEVFINYLGGAFLSEFDGILSPITYEDRLYIVKKAYIPTKSRQRHQNEIDRAIRDSCSLSAKAMSIQKIEDTSNSNHFEDIIKSGKAKPGRIMLLIGSAGCGKSTYLDYLTEVGLSDDILTQISIIRLDMKTAPLDPSYVYDWVCENMIKQIAISFPDHDLDELDTIEKIFSVELNREKKGVLSIYNKGSEAYINKYAEIVDRLNSNTRTKMKCVIRYFCGQRNKLPIVIFDNSDKGNSGEQLLMFEVSMWIMKELKCMIFLPIRDTTFDLFKDQPPLDTTIKELQFRIDPPPFVQLLKRRIELISEEIAKKELKSGKRSINIVVGKNMHHEVKLKDMQDYISALADSILDNKRSVVPLIQGIGGRNLRNCIELFMKIARSGYISTKYIFRSHVSKNNQTIPHWNIMMALIKGSKKYYHDFDSGARNLFQRKAGSSSDLSHLTKYCLLNWFNQKKDITGPNKYKGFHQIGDFIRCYCSFGINEDEVIEDYMMLLKYGLLERDDLKAKYDSNNDLVRISPSGIAHLKISKDPNYLGSISEAIYYSDQTTYQNIVERMDVSLTSERWATHYNGIELLKYLLKINDNYLNISSRYLKPSEMSMLKYAKTTLNKSLDQISTEVMKDPWFEVQKNIKIGEEYSGIIIDIKYYGILVQLKVGVCGLINNNYLKRNHIDEKYWPTKNSQIQVIVKWIDLKKRHISLEPSSSESWI